MKRFISVTQLWIKIGYNYVMIQRIQSIYLLMAIIITMVAILLFADRKCITLKIGYIVLMSLSVVLSVTALFRYTRRKSQIKLINTSIFNLCIAIVLSGIFFLRTDSATAFNYMYIILPSIAILFNYLARKAIVCDEMKVKSADRIR